MFSYLSRDEVTVGDEKGKIVRSSCEGDWTVDRRAVMRRNVHESGEIETESADDSQQQPSLCPKSFPVSEIFLGVISVLFLEEL